MLCDKCKKNQANVFVKENINGKISEQHLCSECAGGKFIKPSFDNFWDMSAYLTNMFPSSKLQELPEEKICPVCKSSLNDIIQSGKVGCGNCYSVYETELLPNIRRIHGNVLHTGKLPAAQSAEYAKKRKLEKLQDEMKKAIEAQNFEKAAVLRDEIKAFNKEA